MHYKMVLILLLLFHVNGMMTQLNTSSTNGASEASIDFKTSKPVICEYIDAKMFTDPLITPLEPECMPCECDLFVFDDFEITNKSKIIANEALIKRLTCEKPVILSIRRTNTYMDWVHVLKPDGNPEEVKALVEFAKAHPNVIGFRVTHLAPSSWGYDSLSLDIAKYIVPYLKGLKYKDDFIVVMSVYPYGPIIKSPCIYDFAVLNGVVDLYEVNTYFMNECQPDISNRYDPLEIRVHGPKYMISLEEVTKFLLASKIDVEKMYFVVGISPSDSKGKRSYYTYGEVCKSSDLTFWCADNTKDFYNKGAYAKKQRAGISVRVPILDDPFDLCGCGPFIATRNIVAGFHAKDPIPCKKIDVKTTS